MKHLTGTLQLFALALLCGCGGGGERGGSLPSGPSSSSLDITGNWQVSLTSTLQGTSPTTISGGITQSGNSVNGTVHVGGSNCFDQLMTIGITGTLTGNNVSLTSTTVAGQVVSLTASISNNELSGTYAIHGGCADGDQGSASGFKIPSFSGRWRSGFEINDQHFYGLADVTQGSVSSAGSFGIGGEVDDSGNVGCLSGTISPGMFPSPSFIIGSSLSLEIETSDGTIVFLGTLNQAGTEFIGTHHIVGGTCNGFLGGACFGRDFHALCHLP